MAREGFFVDAARTQASRSHALGDGSRGVGQLGAPTVVDAHDQVQSLAMSGRSVSLFQRLDHARPQARAASAPAHVHAPLRQLVGAPCEYVGGVVHDEGDLGGRSLPILCREGVDAEVAHARVDCPRDGVHKRILPRPVALGAGQAARVRPAPISVHDEGDVCGDFAAPEGGRIHVPLAGSQQGCRGIAGGAVHGGGAMGGHW